MAPLDRIKSKFIKQKKLPAKKIKMMCLTGGPGAGKTALSEVLQREFGSYIYLIPESASIIYRSLPRPHSKEGQKIMQKAIYHLQSCSEEISLIEQKNCRAIVCDRGTPDGAAYWPGGYKDFFKSLNIDWKAELNKYDVVIHLESPGLEYGYNFQNPLRIEKPTEAKELDQKLLEVWKSHPKRFIVKSRQSFVDKVDEVLSLIKTELEL